MGQVMDTNILVIGQREADGCTKCQYHGSSRYDQLPTLVTFWLTNFRSCCGCNTNGELRSTQYFLDVRLRIGTQSLGPRGMDKMVSACSGVVSFSRAKSYTDTNRQRRDHYSKAALRSDDLGPRLKRYQSLTIGFRQTMEILCSRA